MEAVVRKASYEEYERLKDQLDPRTTLALEGRDPESALDAGKIGQSESDSQASGRSDSGRQSQSGGIGTDGTAVQGSSEGQVTAPAGFGVSA